MKEKYNDNAQTLVLEILKLSEDTAPVTISFGYVLDKQCMNGLVIKDAPGKVIKHIVNSPLVLTASVTPEGLHVLVNP